MVAIHTTFFIQTTEAAKLILLSYSYFKKAESLWFQKQWANLLLISYIKNLFPVKNE